MEDGTQADDGTATEAEYMHTDDNEIGASMADQYDEIIQQNHMMSCNSYSGSNTNVVSKTSKKKPVLL